MRQSTILFFLALSLISCGKKVACANPQSIYLNITTTDTASYQQATITRYTANASFATPVDSTQSAIGISNVGSSYDCHLFIYVSSGYDYAITLHPSDETLKLTNIAYQTVYVKQKNNTKVACSSNMSYSINGTKYTFPECTIYR
jgi:hypothetical protein